MTKRKHREMQRFSQGDEVRIDIPDESDPDHELYHGRHGEVITVFSDEADGVTADRRDTFLYRVEFNDDSTADFRWRDLRPPFDR